MKTHLLRLPRYTSVAIFCALIHNFCLIVADRLGANIFWCQATSAAVLLPVGFWLQSHVTFRCERGWAGFMRYSLALITNFPVALLILWLTRDLLALSMWIAAPLSSVALFCWNYATSTWALGKSSSRVPAHG